MGTSPGCATHVPSWPSRASRSLSALTFASAAALASASLLDGNLRRHAAHRVRAAAVAGLDEQLAVGARAQACHGDLRAIRQHEIALRARSCLDQLRRCSPSARSSARRCGPAARKGSRPSRRRRAAFRSAPSRGWCRAECRACAAANRKTSFHSARLQVALHLRQVEVRARCRARAAPARCGRRTGRNRTATPRSAAPSISTCASSRCQPRGRTISTAVFGVELVALAAGGIFVSEACGAPRRIRFDLAFDDVRPGGRIGVLEVGHEARSRRS